MTSTALAPGTAASDDAFYKPPDPLPLGKPGELIRSVALASSPSGTNGYRILYHSRSVSGADIAVSGVVFVPTGASSGPRPVLSYAHATSGLADRCAPSKHPTAQELGLIALAATGRGYVVAATDYEGLGTPGVHPYLVGQSEGRSVLDAARAAERIVSDQAAPVVIWGHSQGGGAALFAAELAPSYAPELTVKGVVAGAPPTTLDDFWPRAVQGPGGPVFGYVFMAAAGFRAAYPALDLTKEFTPAGLVEVRQAETQCSEPADDMSGKLIADYLKASPDDDPAFASAVAANTAGNHPTSVPIFVYHGAADEVVPVAMSANYLARACRTGGYTILRTTYPSATHTSVILAALPDIASWLSDRLAGRPAPSTPCPRI